MSRADTEAKVRAFLEDYAWMPYTAPEERAAEIDCIMVQVDLAVLDGLTEKYAGQAWEPGPEAWREAHGFALSALYECHDEPHTETCPRRTR